MLLTDPRHSLTRLELTEVDALVGKRRTPARRDPAGARVEHGGPEIDGGGPAVASLPGPCASPWF